MLSLRDLLTGAVPGNSLNQIGLGDASDPQFNRFTYNISGSLGPSPGVNTGMPTISTGPYSNGAPVAPPPSQPKGSPLPLGAGQPTGLAYGGTGQAYQYPRSAPGSPNAMAEGMPATESLINPGVLGGPGGPFGSLRSAMTAWKYNR